MMNCFPCFKKSETADDNVNNVPVAPPKDDGGFMPQPTTGQTPPVTSTDDVDSSHIQAKQFTFRELATATKHFRQECLLSECGFGRIYKGTLQPNGQIVFVKRLDKNSTQGNKEFLVEVLMLSLLHHPNLLNLVGYCADGDQRLLVYEYMPTGSVEEHLLDLKSDTNPLDWVNRMKIACGTAQGLEYLHEKANPPIIYRDLKCSNIMLDEEFNPKLSDYGLAKLGGTNKQVTIMGSYGYCAPEYEKHGELTLKSDVYSFGVILLELITGRKAVDTSKQTDEQNLVTWAQPIFRDPKRFPEMADPRLGNSFPVKSLNQAVGVAAMCLQDEPDVRPLISDVVVALSFLAIASPVPDATPPEIKAPSRKESRRDDKNETRIKAPSRKESRRDKNETEYSEGESSESPWSSDDEQNDDEKDGSDYEPVSEAIMRLNSTKNDDDHHQEKAKSVRYPSSVKYPSSSWGRMDSIEYEVASMSSSSSSSDYESQRGSINMSNNKFQDATNNSLKMTNKNSTKKYREESEEGSWNEGVISTSSRQSSRNTSARLGSKGINDVMLENQNIGSYSRKSSNVESDKNQTIGSYSRQSSIAESEEDGSVRSSHHSDKNEDSEEVGLL